MGTAERYLVTLTKDTMTTGSLASGGMLQPSQGVPPGLQRKIEPPTQRFMVNLKPQRRSKKHRRKVTTS